MDILAPILYVVIGFAILELGLKVASDRGWLRETPTYEDDPGQNL